ncbi:hypothetical protein ACLBXJ_04140 [Methylobacterium mesophilicum]
MTAGLETFAKVRALHDSTTSAGEKESAAARMKAIAVRAGLTVEQALSKLDTPKPVTDAQSMVDAFASFMDRPEAVAERNEREARQRFEVAAILAQYGSEDAVFTDTPMEAALRAAFESLLGQGDRSEIGSSLDGWGTHASRATMPLSVRHAASQAWPMPETVASAWAEYEAADRLTHERYVVDDYFNPYLFTEARQQLVVEILNTLPARSLNDMRARGAWLGHWADGELEQSRDDQRAVVAALRADIERMGQRLREQDATTFGNSEPKPASPVQTGQPARPTRADRHAAIRTLVAEGHGDREIARRLGISPTTVGTVRRGMV